MARRFLCVVLGHRWVSERMKDKSVRRTCRRCGEVAYGEQARLEPWQVPPGGSGGAS
jgi:hypothetical protein